MENNFNIQRNFNINGNSFNGGASFSNNYSMRNSNIQNFPNTQMNHNIVPNSNVHGVGEEATFHQNRVETNEVYKSVDGQTWTSKSDAFAANKKYYQELIDSNKKQN